MELNIGEKNLNINYLEQLLKEYWFAPCDAYMRAAEMAIWNTVSPKKRVLNIGCADGKMDTFLFNNIDIDMAIDNDNVAIMKAKRSGASDNVALADAEIMPFRNNSFSSVISNSTFEHIINDLNSINEVSRVLKKNGDFMLTVPTKRFDRFMKDNGVMGKRLKYYNKRVGHFHYRSLNEWKKNLYDCGLELKYYKYYFPPEMMKIWWRLFGLTTWKVYNRELWSYITDHRFRRYFASNLISKIYILLLKNSYKKAFSNKGCMLFLWARKIK